MFCTTRCSVLLPAALVVLTVACGSGLKPAGSQRSAVVYVAAYHQATGVQASAQYDAIVTATFDPLAGAFSAVGPEVRNPKSCLISLTRGANPQFLVAAGPVQVYPINASGTLGRPVWQAASGACVPAVFDASGQFLYAPFAGPDGTTIRAFSMDSGGRLLDLGESFAIPGEHSRVFLQQAHSGSDGERLWAAVDDCSGDACGISFLSFKIDEQSGALSQPVWSEDGEASGGGSLVFAGRLGLRATAARGIETYRESGGEIHPAGQCCSGIYNLAWDPNAEVLYAHGYDRVLAFAVGQTTAQVTPIASAPLAKAPESSIAIAASGDVVFVNGRDSLVAFRLDRQAGTLTRVASMPVTGAPMGILVEPQ